VPNRYFEELWRRNHSGKQALPDAKSLSALRGEVFQRIERHVLTVIPHAPDAAPAQLVSVTAFDELPATIAEASPPAARDKSRGPSNRWRTVGLCIIAVVGLVVLRSLLPSKGKQAVVASDGGHAAPAPHGSEFESAPLRSLRRPHAVLGQAGEELADVVREDPDAAAEILRTWIGNAS
jgi:flagellar M-ring protein FliF